MELSKPLLANSDLEAIPALRELMLYSVTGDSRIEVSFPETLPVPINGSNLETQVMANPLSMYHASRLCLPLPYLRCQLTFLPPPWSHHMSSVSVCLPLPGLTGTLPPMKNL
jgi:hypothetical protein